MAKNYKLNTEVFAITHFALCFGGKTGLGGSVGCHFDRKTKNLKGQVSKAERPVDLHAGDR